MNIIIAYWALLSIISTIEARTKTHGSFPLAILFYGNKEFVLYYKMFCIDKETKSLRNLTKNVFWQLISNFRGINISHVCDTVIKQVIPLNHRPHLLTDRWFWMCQNMSQIMSNLTYLFRPTDIPYFVHKNTICFTV